MKYPCPVCKLCVPRCCQLKRIVLGQGDTPIACHGAYPARFASEADESVGECFSPRRCMLLIVLGSLLSWGLIIAAYYVITRHVLGL